MNTYRQLHFLFLLFSSSIVASAQHQVKLISENTKVVLSNDFVQVTIDKKKAFISSLKYKGEELIGKQHVNWNIVSSDDDDSKITRLPGVPTYSVTIDPLNNNGSRAEVAFKYVYNSHEEASPVDIEMHFALGREDKGVYLSALISHHKGYPAFQLGQGRMIVELNPKIFDYYTVDSNRNRVMATGYDVQHGIRRNVKEAVLLTTGIHKGEVEHKYDYAAILTQTPTWGWTSTEKNVGVWMINPSFEYINGGPTQVGITGHVDKVLLNHWQDGHYGGAALQFAKDEEWQKFIGPFYIYCNSASGQKEMWKDAITESQHQRNLWPFNWVQDNEYPKKAERGVVKGQIKVNDPYLKKPDYSKMWVGLAKTSGGNGSNEEVNWQYEGKNYQFWTKADASGKFTISNIRPGRYVLYAFAEGILGEFRKTDISVKKGIYLDLGKLVWTPVRYGKPLWEIGIPDRSAAEFRHGDHYWQWGLYMLYPKEFPNDVNYVIGKSEWSKDWNYCQPPVIDSNYKVVRPSVWTISFNESSHLQGNATLRLAICGSRNNVALGIYVNDVFVGNTRVLPNMGVMHRDGIRGKEEEVNIPFDAALLKKGNNTIQLKLIKAKNWTMGILYDYLRLEVNENPLKKSTT